MKILLIGNGGREHALAQAIKRSEPKPQLINLATYINPGINILADEIVLGDFMDKKVVQKTVANHQPHLVIIGPDDPIGVGMADIVRAAGVACFAPGKKGAQLESSKAFTRNLCQQYQIPGQPDYLVSTQLENLAERKSFFDQHQGQIVVKADGLLGGKGVIVANEHFQTLDEAEDFARKSIEKFGRVVLEEKLIGQEFSLISIVDGQTVLDCPAIQDHKRAFNGDTGPNTGGMGCVSDENHSLPFLTQQDLDDAHQITEKVMQAVNQETGERFVGVMYGGFMVTASGVKLIEYNARFGDPEALNILPILETDFLEVCQKAVTGNLKDLGSLKFKSVATVVKYLCPRGYPTDSVKNVPITVGKNLEELPHAYFASVALEDDEMLLKGSRGIGILGTGQTMAEAKTDCQAQENLFTGPLFSRDDIGDADRMKRKCEQVKELRK